MEEGDYKILTFLSTVQKYYALNFFNLLYYSTQMKKLSSVFLLVSLLVNQGVFAQSETKRETGLLWYTDIVKANEASMASNKPLFAFFTGSDWCGWCKRLQNDVFSKSTFIDWAKNNVVLVELDFPRFKSLSPELAQQNNSLQQTFGIQGYPTIWLFYMKPNTVTMKFDIDAIGSVGYPQAALAGKEELKFLSDINALFDKRKAK